MFCAKCLFSSCKAKTSTKTKAFSLIEFMVVMSIVGVLVAIGVAAYQTYNTKSKVGSLSSIGDYISQRSIEYSNPMGFAVLTLNGASFPNNMAIGTDPGFKVYTLEDL